MRFVNRLEVNLWESASMVVGATWNSNAILLNSMYVLNQICRN